VRIHGGISVIEVTDYVGTWGPPKGKGRGVGMALI
jgi:hypothetical protein